jgi:cell division protein FtsB
MNENQIERTLMAVQGSSRVAVVMVVIGLLFVVSLIVLTGMKAREVAHLQTQIEDKRDQLEALALDIKGGREDLDELQRELAAKKAEFDALKANVEGLYAVHVTDANQVFEVKATAEATGRQTSNGSEYLFAAFINAPPETLASIREVEYRFEHPTFRKPVQVANDRATAFRVEYSGWGCLEDVGVTIRLRDDSSQDMRFDMCKSLQHARIPPKELTVSSQPAARFISVTKH